MAKDEKAERLAAALRANLQRRKAQARGQDGVRGEATMPENDIGAKDRPA